MATVWRLVARVPEPRRPGRIGAGQQVAGRRRSAEGGAEYQPLSVVPR